MSQRLSVLTEPHHEPTSVLNVEVTSLRSARGVDVSRDTVTARPELDHLEVV